jgi:DUF1365 family protein
VVTLRDSDHLGDPQRPVADNIREYLGERGVQAHDARITMLTNLRVAGYVFNPVSFFYVHGPDGELRCILAEVSNTFGERHCYVAQVGSDRSVHSADKNFHVSPFFDVSGQYRFTLRAPAATLDVVVENIKDGTRTHLANIKARMHEATTANFMTFALRNPLSTLGVTFAIHWQAFLLWTRGARYHSRPAVPETLATVAVADTLPSTLVPDAKA